MLKSSKSKSLTYTYRTKLDNYLLVILSSSLFHYSLLRDDCLFISSNKVITNFLEKVQSDSR